MGILSLMYATHLQQVDLRFHPAFRWRLNLILGELRGLDWRPKIHKDAFRTLQQEMEKVRQKKSSTLHSWHVVGTQKLMRNGKDEVDVVYGNAADIIDERYGWGGPAKDPNFKFWQDLGRIAKKHGCRWGGDWKKPKDPAHIEFLFIESRPQDQVCV